MVLIKIPFYYTNYIFCLESGRVFVRLRGGGGRGHGQRGGRRYTGPPNRTFKSGLRIRVDFIRIRPLILITGSGSGFANLLESPVLSLLPISLRYF